MDWNAVSLEALGTVGATGGGLVGIMLLIRQLWKMVTGQIAEQRLLLADARESRQDIVHERDVLKERVEELRTQNMEDEREHHELVALIRNELYDEATMRRRWAEHGSECKRIGIEQGVPVDSFPPAPSRSRVH